MRHRVVLILFTVLTVSAVSAQEWKTDLGQARRESLETGKPLFVVVTGGIWCEPCRWFDTHTLYDSAVAERLSRSFVAVKLLDADIEARDLPFDRLPTVMVFRPGESEPLFITSGAITAGTLLARLEQLATETATSPEIDSISFELSVGRITFINGVWRTIDAGLPPELDLYEEDADFRYVRNRDAGILLALPRSPGKVWRWNSSAGDWEFFTEVLRIE